MTSERDAVSQILQARLAATQVHARDRVHSVQRGPRERKGVMMGPFTEYVLSIENVAFTTHVGKRRAEM